MATSSGVALPNSLQTAYTASAPTTSILQAGANTSSFYNPKYSINNFIPLIEIEYEDGTVDIIPDISSYKLTQFLNSLTAWSPYFFKGIEKLPGISYLAYGTTSLDWLIAMYNGITHAYEIQSGSIIKIPSINQINAYLQTAAVVNNVGKIVTI